MSSNGTESINILQSCPTQQTRNVTTNCTVLLYVSEKHLEQLE